MAKTRAQLKTAIRQLTNTENNTGFIQDAELNDRINEAIQELYDLVLETYKHYYVLTSPFTLAGNDGGDVVALPAGFYKDVALDKWPGTTRKHDVPALGAFAERFAPPHGHAYLIRAGSLIVTPARTCAGDYLLYYAPDAPQLTDDSDPTTGTLDAILGKYPLFIELHAAVAVKSKREQDCSVELARLGDDTTGERGRVRSALSHRSEQPGQAARPHRRSPWDGW